MPIKKLVIRNFKSIKSIMLGLKPINLFFGQPNGGKSNILESLGLISALNYNQYARSREKQYFSQSFVRNEHLMNLFYDNNIKEQVTIDLDDIRFVVESTERGYQISYQDLKDDILASKRTLIEFSDKGFPLRVYDRETILNQVKYLKFYRFGLHKEFPYKHTDFILPPDGGNLTAIIQTNNQLCKIINNLLLPFKLELNIRIDENKIEFLKQIEHGRMAIPFSLIAENIQRLIFLLSIIFSNKNSTIVLEEPETHLFPCYTKFLAETIALQLDDNKNQYLFSTHSPYFLTSILEKTETGKVSVFAVRYKKNKTEVHELSEKEIEDLLYQEQDPFFGIDEYFELDS